jgi:hypothetical protein
MPQIRAYFWSLATVGFFFLRQPERKISVLKSILLLFWWTFYDPWKIFVMLIFDFRIQDFPLGLA